MDINQKRQILEQISQADVFEGGSFFTDGDYDLIVDRLHLHQGHEGTSFIAEFFIERSKSTEPGVEARPAGTRVSSVNNLTKHKAPATANAKALCLAVAGMTQDDLKREQAAENATAANEGRQPRDIFTEWLVLYTNTDAESGAVQPARGRRVRASTYRSPSRAQKAQGATRDKWNTYPRFRPCGEQDVASALKLLDGTATVQTPSTPAAPPAPTPTPAPVAAPSAQIKLPF